MTRILKSLVLPIVAFSSSADAQTVSGDDQIVIRSGNLAYSRWGSSGYSDMTSGVIDLSGERAQISFGAEAYDGFFPMKIDANATSRFAVTMLNVAPETIGLYAEIFFSQPNAGYQPWAVSRLDQIGEEIVIRLNYINSRYQWGDLRLVGTLRGGGVPIWDGSFEGGAAPRAFDPRTDPLTIRNWTGQFTFRLPGSAVKLTGFSAAIPEPATWAMMIGGFGLIGAAYRLRRRQAHYA